MHNQQQVHRLTARSVAVADRQSDARQKLLLVGGYAIASTTIALWLAYLPNLAGSVLDAFNIVPHI